MISGMHCTRISGFTAAAAAKKQLSCHIDRGSQTWSRFLMMEMLRTQTHVYTETSPPSRVAWEELHFHFLHGQLIPYRTTIIAASILSSLTDWDRLAISETPQPWPTINSFSSSPNLRKASEISSSSGSEMEAKKPMKLEKWKICQNYLLFTVVWMSPWQSPLPSLLIVAF